MASTQRKQTDAPWQSQAFASRIQTAGGAKRSQRSSSDGHHRQRRSSISSIIGKLLQRGTSEVCCNIRNLLHPSSASRLLTIRHLSASTRPRTSLVTLASSNTKHLHDTLFIPYSWPEWHTAKGQPALRSRKESVKLSIASSIIIYLHFTVCERKSVDRWCSIRGSLLEIVGVVVSESLLKDLLQENRRPHDGPNSNSKKQWRSVQHKQIDCRGSR